MSDDIVYEIKSRLPIEELVAQYVPLKKAGRNFKAHCPFHSEKTPSFMVSPEKQIAYCFGCHKGGDIFKFTQEMEGVEFPEAIKILAEKTGVKISKFSRFQKGTKKSEKEPLLKAQEKVTGFFQSQLKDTEDGKKVLDYLVRRGINDESVKQFRIGFAPDSFDASHKFLLKEGVKKDSIVKCGLVSSKGISSDKQI